MLSMPLSSSRLTDPAGAALIPDFTPEAVRGADALIQAAQQAERAGRRDEARELYERAL